MDVILLPLVDAQETTLEGAFSAMHDAKRSGIVGRIADDFRLYTADEVVFALADLALPARSGAMLSGLTGKPIHQPDIATVASATPQSYIASAQLLLVLAAANANYGLLAAGDAQGRTQAMVFTRSEKLRSPLESEPADCYCVLKRDPVSGSSTCPLDGSAVRCR